MDAMIYISVGLLIVLAILVWLRPKDEGGEYTPYFQHLNNQLRNKGSAQPRMIVDLDCLDHNLALLKNYHREVKPVRLVVKSLASLPLLDHCMRALDTDKLMVFDISFLRQVVKRWPHTSIMMGKPIPVAAVSDFYGKCPGQDLTNIIWLVDNEDRLQKMVDLASRLEIKINLAIELDIGFHRGGIETASELINIIAILKESSWCQLTGLMGYDPHLSKIPDWLGRSKLLEKSQGIYRKFLQVLTQECPGILRSDFIINGAGSPTFRLHTSESPLNEVSVGSALLKPDDFSLPLLSDFKEALYIAAPVLKKSDGPTVPLLERFGKSWALWNPNRRQTFFLYGGYWKAKVESPKGMLLNPIFGRSSNQELLSGSLKVRLDVDDHIFLKPTQSEAVLGQLGPLMTYRKSGFKDHWPVMTHVY